MFVLSLFFENYSQVRIRQQLRNPPVYNIWCDQSKEQKSLRNLFDQNTEHTLCHIFFPGWVLFCKTEISKANFSKFILLAPESNLYPLTLASVLACAVSVKEVFLTQE